MFQTERWEFPRRRLECFDTIDNKTASGRCEEVLMPAVFAPFHRAAVPPEAQWYAIALCMPLQHPQVELHQVPANDRVGIVPFQPSVQLFQHLPMAVAVFQVEVEWLFS